MHFRSPARQVLALIAGGCVLSGCSPKEHDAVVATVNMRPISLSEYESQYLKNAPNRDSAANLTMAERQRFLDLMINYRLKLAEAERERLDQNPAVQNEIRQYKGALASSYVIEREVVTPGLHKLYQMREEEIRPSHILLALPPNAPSSDSIAAYKKAADLIDAIKKGAQFDSLARAYSTDPSAQQNGGDLYYFTGGTMIPAFEDAAYSIPVGQIGLVHTNYGLHIIKVVDRHAAQGEMRAGHIMVRFPSMNPPPADTVASYARIRAIQDSLSKGVDFAALARRNSSDPSSAANGGDLGWFARRRWPQSFDEAAFKLSPGQTSGIVKSPYGYHIIRCYERRPRKSFEDSKQEIQQVYQQLRYENEQASRLGRLKKDLGLRRNIQPVLSFLARCDSNKTTSDSAWASGLTPDLGRSVVFSAHGEDLTLDSLVSVINHHPDIQAVALRPNTFEPVLDKIEDLFAWTVAADSVARVRPDFGAIMQEYRDGVVLYQMEQQHVWNKLAPSDSLLRLFYAKNRDRFVWPDRLDVTELHMMTPKTAKAVSTLMASGKSMETIVYEDSVRMSAPSKFETFFRQKSADLTPDVSKTLANVAGQLSRDTSLTLQMVVYQDTGKASSVTEKRIEAMKKYLTEKLKLEASKIATTRRTVRKAVEEGIVASARTTRLRQVDISVAGKQPLIEGKPESSLVPAISDERSMKADSLTPGKSSAPFMYQHMYTIVRLNRREPSRVKLYEEAPGEVSSAYQDAETKRLEDQWLKELHSSFPVTVNTDALHAAFSKAKP